MHVYLNLFLYLAPKLPKGKTTFCVCINRTQRNRMRIDSIMSIKFVFQEGSSRSKRKKSWYYQGFKLVYRRLHVNHLQFNNPLCTTHEKYYLDPGPITGLKAIESFWKKAINNLYNTHPFFVFVFLTTPSFSFWGRVDLRKISCEKTQRFKNKLFYWMAPTPLTLAK